MKNINTRNTGEHFLGLPTFWDSEPPSLRGNWVASLLQLAQVQVMSTGKVWVKSRRNAVGQASGWGSVGQCASVISSPVHEFTGPLAVKWNSPSRFARTVRLAGQEP